MLLRSSLSSQSILEHLVALTERSPRIAGDVPIVHQALQALGVLDQSTGSWSESATLAKLPWGPTPADEFSAHLPADLEGPWPSEGTLVPGFVPRVSGIPEDERQLHRTVTVHRYMKQLATLVPVVAARALREPGLRPISDARFAALINETSFSQFMVELEPRDHQIFASHMRAHPAPADAWVKIDSTIIDSSATLPGVFAAPTRTLLRYDAERETFEPLAIHFEDSPSETFTPGDGAAWELARYFVLQGLAYLLVLVFHPRLHLPGDVVNAVTRTVLGTEHRVHQVLAPHLRYALGLNEAVINHRRSVLHNSQRELYTPFPFETDAIHRGALAGFRGLPGRTAYPEYRWQRMLLDPRTPYGRYRRDWFANVEQFVAESLPANASQDPALARWADSIAAWVPGFPGARAIRQPGALVEALTTFIAHTGLFHTADHHSYGKLDAAEVPWRLRVAPPNRVRPSQLDYATLVSTEDKFRHLLAQPMFFESTVVESIDELRYDFGPDEDHAACTRFARRMRSLDQRWAGSSFPSSAELATSVQS